MLSENEINLKYNTTGLAGHREPFTNDIEGVEVVQNSIYGPRILFVIYHICISCAYNFDHQSSLKKYIMLLFFRICLVKNVWKLQALKCGLKLFVYHP